MDYDNGEKAKAVRDTRIDTHMHLLHHNNRPFFVDHTALGARKTLSFPEVQALHSKNMEINHTRVQEELFAARTRGVKINPHGTGYVPHTLTTGSDWVRNALEHNKQVTGKDYLVAVDPRRLGN